MCLVITVMARGIAWEFPSVAAGPFGMEPSTSHLDCVRMQSAGGLLNPEQSTMLRQLIVCHPVVTWSLVLLNL